MADDKGLGRRAFLAAAAAAPFAARAALGGDAEGEGGGTEGGEAPPAEDPPAETPGEEKRDGVVYRTLGKTGFKASVLGFGCMRTREPRLLQQAFDAGVNYFDTAQIYGKGKNEPVVGQALKGKRDKVWITTKVRNRDPRQIAPLLEASLRKIGTDHVDLYLIHAVQDPQEVNPSAFLEALGRLKKAGKIRFSGVSTHQNEVACVDEAIRGKFHECVLVKYNFMSPQPIKDVLKRAHDAGLGVIGMKTQSGGYQTGDLGGLSPHQAMLKAVLEGGFVHTTIPGMASEEHLRDNVGVMTKGGLSLNDRRMLGAYAAAVRGNHCTLCGSCDDACPKGVNIQHAGRSLMYLEGYKDPEVAREAYAELGAANGAVCATCSYCTAACPDGLDIRGHLLKAHERLG